MLKPVAAGNVCGAGLLLQQLARQHQRPGTLPHSVDVAYVGVDQCAVLVVRALGAAPLQMICLGRSLRPSVDDVESAAGRVLGQKRQVGLVVLGAVPQLPWQGLGRPQQGSATGVEPRQRRESLGS